MGRGTAALAYSYFLHWLHKEDLYSQQSPFVFTLYQGLVKHLASKQASEEKASALASTSFSTACYREKLPSTPNEYNQQSPYWKPTQKGVNLLAYFCSLTPAQQVLEIGTGHGAVTRRLERIPVSKLYSLEQDPTLWKQAQVKGSPATNYLLGTTEEQLQALLETIDQLDFILINDLLSKAALRAVIERCKPRIHSKTILVLAHIHRSTEMEQAWATVKADASVQLTLDFFDYGLVWFAYPGPKTHVILGA